MINILILHQTHEKQLKNPEISCVNFTDRNPETEQRGIIQADVDLCVSSFCLKNSWLIVIPIAIISPLDLFLFYIIFLPGVHSLKLTAKAPEN